MVSKAPTYPDPEKPIQRTMSKSPSKLSKPVSVEFKVNPIQTVSENQPIVRSEIKKSTLVQKNSIGSNLFSEAPKLKSSAFERLSEKSIFKNLLRQATTSNAQEPMPSFPTPAPKSKSPNKVQKGTASSFLDNQTDGLRPEIMRSKNQTPSKSPTRSQPKLQATAPVATSRSPTPGKMNGKISVIKGSQFTLPDFNTDSFNAFTLEEDRKTKNSFFLNAPLKKGQEILSKKLVEASKTKMNHKAVTSANGIRGKSPFK